MAKRLLLKVGTVLVALFILVVSFVETSSVKYAFGAKNLDFPLASPKVNIAYPLETPDIMPGTILWPAKALHEKINLGLTSNALLRSKYELHLADTRLAAGRELWKTGDVNEALLTFEKAEGYLAQSYEDAKESKTNDTLSALASASLKHREVLENVLAECGDDARPTVAKMLDNPKILYQKLSAQMEGLNLTPPANPF